MTDLHISDVPDKRGLDRRTVLRGAAWSAPVLAVAVAAPLASASVGNAGLAFTSSSTGFLTLSLLDGSSVITAGALVTVPTEFTITNGPGAINDTAAVTVVVGRPGGIPLSVGRARGFGVYGLNGSVVAAQNSVSYQSLFGVEYGFPITTFTGTLPVVVSSNGFLAVPIEFGLSGVSDAVSITALASFPVTLTVDFGGGNSYTASSTISIAAGAGIL